MIRINKIDTSAYAIPNSQNLPIIEGDCVYLFLNRVLFCFNKLNGETIWSSNVDFTGGNARSNYILAKDFIVFVSDLGYLTAIDKISGEIKYSIDHGASIDYIGYYNDRLYYTSSYLYIADINNGELLHKIETHNYSQRTPGSFANGVVFNKDLGYLYLNDGFYAMCIKIPE